MRLADERDYKRKPCGFGRRDRAYGSAGTDQDGIAKGTPGMLANNQPDMTGQSPKNIVTFPLHRLTSNGTDRRRRASLAALFVLGWQFRPPAITIGNPGNYRY
ncbi:MAG: hypothetical protein IPM55_23960 [Acidobacteria bacterium]|nr:hypothetical protein [Acidobacteriota bacterium]